MFAFRRLIALCLLVTGMFLSGCGGGGDGNSSPKAAVTFTSSLQDGYVDQVGSLNLTIELPAGVTVPADAAGLIPRSNLAFSGEGARFASVSSFAVIIGKYTPATLSAKAKVSLVINTLENSNGVVSGMDPGEFATLICDVAPGSVFNALTPLSGVVIANTKGDILSDARPPLASLAYAVK